MAQLSPSAFDELAKSFGIPVEKLASLIKVLQLIGIPSTELPKIAQFGTSPKMREFLRNPISGPNELAMRLVEGYSAMGPVIPRLPEAEITKLPPWTQEGIRELEAERNAKRAEIAAYVARFMGLNPAAGEDRGTIDDLVQMVINRWEWREAEMSGGGEDDGAQFAPALQRLLAEHYELSGMVQGEVGVAPFRNPDGKVDEEAFLQSIETETRAFRKAMKKRQAKAHDD